MTDVTVNTQDLRRALQAVVAHASPHPDEDTFHRVRFVIDAVNLQVYATQGFTTGLSIVSVIDHGDGEAGQWDMPPVAVKDLLALFKVSREVAEEACLRFRVDAEHVHVQDVSGLFPGKAVVLPRLPDHDYYPDVPGAVGQALRETSDRLDRGAATSGPWWATFVAATKAYREGMLVGLSRAGGRTRLLITIGDSFVGVLTASQDEERTSELETFRDDWTRRLPTAPRWVRSESPATTPQESPARNGTGYLTVVNDDDEGEDHDG